MKSPNREHLNYSIHSQVSGLIACVPYLHVKQLGLAASQLHNSVSVCHVLHNLSVNLGL